MKDKILVVDMDDSFLKTDLFYEMIFKYLKNNLLNLFNIFNLLLIKNKLFLKNHLVQNVSIDIDNIPVNDSVLSWIKKNKKNYSKIILCSGSPQVLVKKISEKYKHFDEVFGSTKEINLTGNNKVDFLLKKGFKNFDYIGDSFKDIPVWRNSKKKISVNFSKFKSLLFEILFNIKFDKNFNQSLTQYIKSLIKLFRVNQWVKNYLLVIHFLILGYVINFIFLKDILLGFLLFCFASSFGYVFNDILDLESDRAHSIKRNRPFASGDISLSNSFFILLLLVLLGVLVSIPLFQMYSDFIFFVLLYIVLSITYSVGFKKIKFFDCIALSFFFTYRIFCGSLLDLNNNISVYLLLFSFFIFYSFANLKRVVEIKNSSHPNIVGRPYNSSDLRIIFSQGIASLLISAIFLSSILNQLIFFKNNNFNLYLSIILFYFWVMYVWYKAIISKREFDLVTFSYKDKLSLILILIFVSLFSSHNFL